MSSPISDDEVEQIRNAIFAGRTIEAIKLYRQASGKGLKEAKDFVEELEVKLRQASPELFSAPPSKGCALTAILLILFAGTLVQILVISL